MDELFSCRNCIHNSGQSLNIGCGQGFCLHHDSVIDKPERTTCKYLYRKDLPLFTVDEGISEHAYEFAAISGIADLYSHERIPLIRYSEKFIWEQRAFDPLTHALAQYNKSEPSWVFIQAMSGGLDGRRALCHASLVRRYMARCDTWTSSYRLVLAVLQGLDQTPVFEPRDLNLENGDDKEEISQEALWDVFFCRLATIQEYGFHAGIQEMIWATDAINGFLLAFNWPLLSQELKGRRKEWTETVIRHAENENVFFPDAPGPERDPRL